MARLTQADDEETVWRFADVMGPDIAKESCLKCPALRTELDVRKYYIPRRAEGHSARPLSRRNWSINFDNLARLRYDHDRLLTDDRVPP